MRGIEKLFEQSVSCFPIIDNVIMHALQFRVLFYFKTHNAYNIEFVKKLLWLKNKIIRGQQLNKTD